MPSSFNPTFSSRRSFWVKQLKQILRTVKLSFYPSIINTPFSISCAFSADNIELILKTLSVGSTVNSDSGLLPKGF
jgi:hypothetical protein